MDATVQTDADHGKELEKLRQLALLATKEQNLI